MPPRSAVELAAFVALAHNHDHPVGTREVKGLLPASHPRRSILIQRHGENPKLNSIEANLRQALEETEDFRRFYLRQSLDKLL
jgi:hypothetical protein